MWYWASVNINVDKRYYNTFTVFNFYPKYALNVLGKTKVIKAIIRIELMTNRIVVKVLNPLRYAVR